MGSLPLSMITLYFSCPSTSGRERPAGTALALVLDGGEGTPGGLVDGVSVGGLIEVGVEADLLDANLVLEHGSVLSLGPVEELVGAEGVGVAVGVGLLDVLVEDAEVNQAGVELLNGRHVLASC